MKASNSILIFFFLLPTMVIFSQEKMIPYKKYKLPEKGICAHRGASNTHPENTITAFNEAIDLGAQMIEFDVRMTQDKKLVIMHDASVDRTTNGTGLVNNLTLKEIQLLDAGSWKSKEFAGEKAPTFTEVLRIMPNNIWLNIHLKGGKELGKAVAKVLLKENRLHQGVIACGYDAAKGVKKINSSIMICNMERVSDRTTYIDETIEKGYNFIQLQSSRNTNSNDLASDIKRLNKNNVRINYFHAETEKEVKELSKIGIDFILTDQLEKMLMVIKE